METALKESEEEAGLIGEIVGDPVGEYTYSKWGQSLRVEVFLLQVHTSQDEWQEDTVRDRCWVSLEIAKERIQSKRLRVLLVKAASTLDTDHTDNR